MQSCDFGASGGAAADVEAVVNPVRKGPVQRATEAEVRALPKDLRGSAVAATAVAMAGEIDAQGNSATSKSMCAARLVEAMDKLRSLKQDQPTATKLDEIRKQREKRLARRPGA